MNQTKARIANAMKKALQSLEVARDLDRGNIDDTDSTDFILETIDSLRLELKILHDQAEVEVQ